MLGDERDEALNGYDSLIQIYDLDPPEGFSDMESFNAELNAWLDRVHPATREYLDQSLRNGSQTPDKLFGTGHDLVERLQRRIREAINRYIADMRADDKHPSPVPAEQRFRLYRLLVVAAARLRLSHQSCPSRGLDQLLLLCRLAAGGRG